MSNYDYKKLSYYKDLSDIKVPKFQRSLVWTKSKKMDLLRTLHKDFPFGALLITPDHSGDAKYSLLDGQQRLSTIRAYDEHRVAYWKQLDADRYNDYFKEFNLKLTQNHLQPITEATFNQILSGSDQFNQWREAMIAEVNDDDRLKLQVYEAFDRSLSPFIERVMAAIHDYIDLDHLEIPVLEFTGNEVDLPEVYENLNKGGVPLNKYEILSASWFDEKIKMPAGSRLGNEILDRVKKYYERLIQDGVFAISDFSEDDITNSREINLAEFAKALGKLVVDNLFAVVKDSPNMVNEIGFGLMGIITDVDNKKIAIIHNQKDLIQDQLESILNQADRLSKAINSKFTRILRKNIFFASHQGGNRDEFSYGLSSTFKILSYFASMWDLDDHDLKTALDNIPAYYVYDGITKAWNAHGDTRLFDYYSSHRTRDYLTRLDPMTFKRAFNNWNQDNPNIHKQFNQEVRALITIHSNLTYLSNSLSASEDYEFEHVIPRARIFKYDPAPSAVHVSALGNGMFLPKSLNNSKSSKTLYEYDSNNDGVDYQSLRDDSDYFTAAQFDQIFMALKQSRFDDVNAFIDKRAGQMADQIISGLDPNTEVFHQIKPTRNRGRLFRN
ncbi:DUF262 domain-containing protein [Nicoliella spurrieriana]|uniref:DUF262 domain-containing protein n=1 Tax=Nicoliella spurrieriana TaxID=2925830 RepID=A0A976X6E3_9LACO|nr:DUF262 domain-containing protein [Nicoliella spurrieriana]UQS87287.1 DUF262 domain-containing protein [Nicoliella spurrieriana]